ncbi:putative BURP domain-containing protein [Helianthus annuus]|uniref:Putative BURP domain-containing protein n=1 Tax=Helianthus annuus TaxID=4232 RepID=A0A251SY38_HELAN|nr:putative BURP domain-containing protein [Helianthus annuus]KAJ0624776.1 putative BURP domain-containing protein [Helianthus annuus]KAJ0628465.1 putative BURP domain-containing protein [Helianthus annuus]KAJ0803994.1 putative BURP domain-containing protein [Helianthus annuus]KAJ0958612.1 putative BURP domain-containing protein [Helianthus annuus]
MKFFLLLVFTLFSVALVGSHAVTPEVYWKSVLPNSPMPKSIKDLLYSEWNDEKSTAGKSGVGVHTYKGKPLYFDVQNVPGFHTSFLNRYTEAASEKAASVSFLNRYTEAASEKTASFLNRYTEAASEKAVSFLNRYTEAASENQLKDNPNAALFFFENDLHLGKEMNLYFTKNDQKATFLPREIADSIPFSSNKLPQIYNEFSVNPGSMEAKVMKQTLEECEKPSNEGEERYCATSLESMVDFSTTRLGKKVKVISTEVNTKESTLVGKYKIEVAKKFPANTAVICHKLNYAHAVFYCHKTVSTRAYAVSMISADGKKMNVAAVCHTDTSKWNPKHLAFQVLKVKPGTVPICHFLPEDHVAWVPY